jgi:hypothetical protein
MTYQVLTKPRKKLNQRPTDGKKLQRSEWKLMK